MGVELRAFRSGFARLVTSAVLFDLGNTLAAYYHASEFRPILEDAIRSVREELRSRGLADVPLESALKTAIDENREAADFRFTPMVERLERIFRVTLARDAAATTLVCERFLAPIFAVGRVYDDTFPVLELLRHSGVRTAIVSNAPWGSPPELWRHELRRLGLSDAVDAVVLCGDVGWRKPAPQIFEAAAAKLGCHPGECMFIGDDMRWDIEGSRAIGMRAVLIDRDGRHPDYDGERITGLHDVPARLASEEVR